MAFVLYLCAFALYLAYKWATSTFDFFEKQGIPFRKPVPLFGTNANIVTKQRSFSESLSAWYKEFRYEK